MVWDGSETGDRQLQWLVQDHLGSTRMVVDRSGSLGGIRRHDFCPFGEELSAGIGIRSAALGYGDDSIRQKFGSKERDNETGLDFFEARYFSSVQGRFTSVDPENYQAFNDLTDPQSWNAYSYVNNNPLRRTDPDGRGFQEKLKNWWKYGVYGTEDDVKAEEAKRRKEIEAAAAVAQEEALKAGIVDLKVTDANGKPIEKLNRDEVFEVSDNLRKGKFKIETPDVQPPMVGSAPQHPNSSDHMDITRGKGNVPNRETNLTRAEFEQNLSSAGWTKTVRGNGKVVEYAKDGFRYVVRDSAKSTGGPTADFYKPGSKSIDLKIRLQ
jgi:RHS repeat-associated protein